MKTTRRTKSAHAVLVMVALFGFPTAFSKEPANPESKPLKDRSEKASREAQPVEDDSRRAGQDSRPVKDAERRAGQRSQPAGKDGAPIEDDDSKANDRSRKERDTHKQAAPDAARVEDRDDDKAGPSARETSAAERRRNAPPKAELPDAEAAVVEAHEALARDIHQRKLRIQGRDEARGMIDQILGKESRLSRAERERAERAEERQAAREERRAAAGFLRQRLRGQEVRELPPFFRTIAPAEAAHGEPVLPGPYFIHEGRRYVYYPSREAIPAVLLATATLERVRIQPAAELDIAVFGERIPAGYGRDAWVVSYPIASNTTITSHDILFLQGSTRFADDHSYDMTLALADAMLDPELIDARFVIEGHASAEGNVIENQALSQLRAEAIVRQLVRSGVAPDRLVPVGYGENEAHHPADAAEHLRQQDRRVVVSRIDTSAR